MDRISASALFALSLLLTIAACTPDAPTPQASAPEDAAPAAEAPVAEDTESATGPFDASFVEEALAPGAEGVDTEDREAARAEIHQERAEAGLANVPTKVPEDFPRPEGARIVKTDYKDYSEVLRATLTVDQPVPEVAAFYNAEFPKRGWNVSVSRQIADRHSMFANKGEFEVSVDIISETPTRIEMTLYTPDPEDIEGAS